VLGDALALTFCERISKKCGHASLSAKIFHNLLSFDRASRSKREQASPSPLVA
jgi:hypothetical protein